jgi:putative membrane protein
MDKKNKFESTPRPHNRVDHMANERTFLAWIRTSLGIMAFGFVVEKFALFMKQITYFFGKEGVTDNIHISTVQQGLYSSIFGIVLVAFGAVIGLLAFFKYINVEKQIEEDTYQSSLTLAIVLTIAIVVIGIFLVAYLIKS